MKLLILEQKKGMARHIAPYLRREGLPCDVLSTPEEVDRSLLVGYDCVLIRCQTFNSYAKDVLSYLERLNFEGGKVILPVDHRIEACIAGLEAGADDFQTELITPRELTARVSSILRRRKFGGSLAVEVNGLKIDLPGKSVTFQNRPVDLTRIEFSLLLFLLSHLNKVILKEAIGVNLTELSDPHKNDQYLYVHINNLRKKLDAVGCPDYIVAMYGRGYKFLSPGMIR